MLITAEELNKNYTKSDIVLLDCRFNLADKTAGYRAYESGHISGAYYADLEKDMSGTVNPKSGRHPLPLPGAFQAFLRRCGVNTDTTVVVYDEVSGPFAARMFWLCRWAGLQNVRMLDGGQKNWERLGYPLTKDIPPVKNGTVVVTPGSLPTVSADQVSENIRTGKCTLTDARDAKRYAGEEETIDPVAGHIPGAQNRPFSQNLTPDGYFKPGTELRREFETAGITADKPIINYCGSGVTACHNFMAMFLAGYGETTVYPGSWSEWIRIRHVLPLKSSKDTAGCDLAIVGIPFDSAVSNRPGTRLAPRALRNASSMCSWEKPYGWDFNVFNTLKMCDYGDITLDYGRPERIFDAIYTGIKPIVTSGAGTLCIGGDHYVSYPLIKAWYEKTGAPLSLIQFDAHTDTWADAEKRTDHGSMFFHAVNEGMINPKTSVQTGIRTSNADTMGITILDNRYLHQHGAEHTAQEIRRIVGNTPAYLSFDIDFLDPSCAPGTGTPVCGGATSYQAIQLLQALRGLNIVGFDIVEVSPPYDHAEITALAGAAMAVEFMSLYASRPREE
ncbi:hypothetical protein CHS0354_018516 [Potamilus streckersoni]|uniref:Rhodanese domain-containing protein n=1 Tax=Potamilus streckersoni TaxID=2493646 RepID=A0AAE0TAQ6_9BIVA|nr:hypothetical protein CHS0354_018516 [Potamilus streckersoni]